MDAEVVDGAADDAHRPAVEAEEVDLVGRQTRRPASIRVVLVPRQLLLLARNCHHHHLDRVDPHLLFGVYCIGSPNRMCN